MASATPGAEFPIQVPLLFRGLDARALLAAGTVAVAWRESTGADELWRCLYEQRCVMTETFFQDAVKHLQTI